MRHAPIVIVMNLPLLLAGCADGNEPSGAYCGTSMGVEFSFVDYSNKWRTVDFGNFADGTSLGLTISTSGTKKSDLDYSLYNADNIKVSLVGGKWSTGARLLWKGDDNQVSYTAYMPYHEDLRDYAALRVSAVQTAESVVAEDVLSASGTTCAMTSAAEGLKIELGHALAEFDVSLNITDDIYRTTSVSSVVVGNCSLSLPVSSQSETTTLVKIPDTETHYGLMPPQTVSHLKVTINYADGSSMQYVNDSDTKFVANVVNHLILNVSRDKIEKGQAVIEPWKEGDTKEI